MFSNQYVYILIPAIVILASQLFKFLYESIKNKKILWSRFFNGAGGMPSTHTSLMCSILFTIMYKEGLNSPSFAIMLGISMIVMYDSMGVRKNVEKINRIINDTLLKEDNIQLKHDAGHEPIEVLGGMIFAFIIVTIIKFI